MPLSAHGVTVSPGKPVSVTLHDRKTSARLVGSWRLMPYARFQMLLHPHCRESAPGRTTAVSLFYFVFFFSLSLSLSRSLSLSLSGPMPYVATPRNVATEPLPQQRKKTSPSPEHLRPPCGAPPGLRNPRHDEDSRAVGEWLGSF